jgi:hypothetical protein
MQGPDPLNKHPREGSVSHRIDPTCHFSDVAIIEK